MKEQQTIRIDSAVNERIKKKATEIGCSYNSLILIYLSLGEKAYKKAERATLQNPQ